MLEEKRQSAQELNKAIRFKNNADIFWGLLQQQRKVDTIPFIQELEIASAGAPLQIVVACNPYCGPCAKAHFVIHEVAEKYEGKISIAIRFTINANKIKDKNTHEKGRNRNVPNMQISTEQFIAKVRSKAYTNCKGCHEERGKLLIAL